MSDAIWVRIQATCRCAACSEATAVNAAVEHFACLGCGAEIQIRDQLWDTALNEARGAAAELDANATTSRDFDLGGTILTLAIAAVDAVCPHCRAEWGSLPEGACPDCGTQVALRPVDAGTLVGEDTHMLAGVRGDVEQQSLSCSGCGSPLTVDGSTRTISCGACSRETVVPDEVWRRVHAPRTVANWWLYTGGMRSAGLSARLRPTEMAGGKGVIYVLGSYGDTPFALMALATDPLAIRWMVDLQQLGKATLTQLAAGGDELFAYAPMSRAIEVFDASSGTHQRTVRVPEPITDLAPHPDGSILCLTTSGALIRVNVEGAPLDLWGKRGFFARLFGGGIVEQAPKKGMGGLQSGRIATGLDGDLRVISRRWIGCLTRDGELRWSAEVEGGNIAIVAPAATPEGTTYAVLRTVGGTMTVAQIVAFTEALADGAAAQSSSVLVRVPAEGGAPTVLRPSGPEEFTSLAVTAEGELWLATGEGELSRLSPDGELLWRQAAPE